MEAESTMNDTDLDRAEARLRDYLNAEARILAGLVAEVNGRRLGLSNLGETQRSIEVWKQQVAIARIQARLRRGPAPDLAPCPQIDEGTDAQ
jgi:hypothetical protein